MLTLTGTRWKTRAAADWRWALGALLVVVMLSFSVVVALYLARPPSKRYSNMPPPPYGYFQLQPVGSYAGSPSDAKAAAEVHRSTWEPRADNTRYNHAITGNFSGTTDEIFQWTAAKWGLPDNLLRTIAYMESGWRQSNLGDYVGDRAECPPGYTRLPCPVTFGIVGTKSTSSPGIFPWNRDST